MNDNKKKPLISIIIPTKNESEDIRFTLNRCLNIEYEPKEIIVVDDSSDNTPEIVTSFKSQGVKLIHRKENRNGCCGARNLGMQNASGEIVVLLNADAIPKKDFLSKIEQHYQNGADFVVVKSVLKNRNNRWGLYKYAESLARFNNDPNWTEGFSCRKSAAKEVGYIPGDFPVPFCRDYRIGQALTKAGFIKHVDMTIEMEHIWPDRLDTFWNNQVHRGAHSAPTYYFFKNSNLLITFLREVVKSIRDLFKIIIIFPPLIYTIKLSKFTDGGFRNIPDLLAVHVIDKIAIIFGNYKGVFRIIKNKQNSEK